ncbi:MAG: rRNA maturation RNase YbeY [Clostridium sp.]|nr:rRNA maturation RNase YbeY [Clostridium sp.]
MTAAIQWLTEGVEMPLIRTDVYERWICKVAELHGRRVGELSYIFCDDATILRVNREFLNHDYFTDIITFDYTRGKLLRGDMYISLDTVLTNSQAVNAPYEEELSRVIIHGVLHLCGINDKGPGEREIMEQNENEALALLKEDC